MAHLVETMAHLGATPWHGLGTKLTPGLPLEVWAKQAGMDWCIKEAPVSFQSGDDVLAFPENKVTTSRG
jgi:hypothetical protein